MRRRSSVLGLFGLLAVFAPAPGHGADRVCGPAATETLDQSDEVRVYRQNDFAYTCRRGDRRRRALASTYCYGSSSGCSVLTSTDVAGRFVAYGIQDDGNSAGDEYFSLRVVDMRTRKLRERHEIGEPGSLNAELRRVVVSRTGGAAWLWRRARRATTPVYVVSRSPRCGAPSTLADGADVSPASLRRVGSRVRWRESGTDRHAALC